MGTRAVIQVVGSNDMTPPGPDGAYSCSVRLYRHHDGGPRECLPEIARSIEMMERLVQESLSWKKNKVRYVAVEPMAHAIIANMMCSHTLAAWIEKTYYCAPTLAQLGNACDLEWLYVVDCKERLVNVYTSKQENDAGRTLYSATPVEHLESGFFRESERVFCGEYIPDVADAMFADFTNGVKAVAATGWRYNDLEDPYLKLVQRAAKKNAPKYAKPDAKPVLTEPKFGVIESAFCI